MNGKVPNRNTDNGGSGREDRRPTAAAGGRALPAPEIVAEWTALDYEFADPAQAAAWRAAGHHRKAMLHGVKVDSAGTLYVSTARWGGPEVPATLSVLVRRGDGWVLRPFPDAAMNRAGDPQALQSVLGFEIDRNDVMWSLDQGHIAGQPAAPGAQKLIRWDLKRNREVGRHLFTPAEADPVRSFLNDIVVDNDSGFAYITDSGIYGDPLHGALIVYDSTAGRVCRVLERTVFTSDEPGFTFAIDGRPATRSAPMRTGADGIALSGDKSTLYWTNLSGHSLYSLDTALLRDFSTPESVLQAAVRRVCTLPSNTDGLTADRDGNLYITALELNGLLYRDAATGEVSHVLRHAEMRWPDTLGWGPDGWLYLVSNHLHLWVDGEMDFEALEVPNFRIWRIQTGARSYTVP